MFPMGFFSCLRNRPNDEIQFNDFNHSILFFSIVFVCLFCDAIRFNADDVVSKLIPTRSDRSTFDAVKRWPLHTHHTEFPNIGFRQLQVSPNARPITVAHFRYLPFFFCSVGSCVADNALGRTKKYIEISGRPGPAEFISPMFSGSLEYYNLTWSVESIPPLEEIRLLYRRLMVSDQVIIKRSHLFHWHVCVGFPLSLFSLFVFMRRACV